jgi:cytochrome c-type biogenesis protein CcsB
MTLEIVVTWVALALYAAATAMSATGVVFSKEKLTNRAVLVGAIGLACQAASLGIRWERVGHGPYLGFYEVASALVFCAVAAFVIAAWRYPRLAGAGIGILPVALLLLGGSMLAQGSEVPVTAKLSSFWLFIHVTFANLAFGAFALSFGCAIVYVVRVHSADGTWTRRFAKLPAQEVLENLTVRFVLLGFLFWGMMIATGSIWANEAWGRYWGWDPIETWSLIVWIIYAVYLHVRFTLKWRGERLAWFAIAAMPLALFALIGIPLAFNTPHAGIGGLGKDL